MERYTLCDGIYVVCAKDEKDAVKVVNEELDRFDNIKAKMANLLTKDGQAYENFMNNTSEDKLKFRFIDKDNPLYPSSENNKPKGEVRQQKNFKSEKGDIAYTLAYRYPEIDGVSADFRVAHELGHLMLNPDNEKKFAYDKETESTQISGLIRAPKGEEQNPNNYYGGKMQENAINLLAQLAIRENISADDIISGKEDLTEKNSYRKCDDLVKQLVLAMRNDFSKEMTFEELMEEKIDSQIELSDGTKEPANVFLYGLVNNTSLIEKEFDKYMGKGAWKELNTNFDKLHTSEQNQNWDKEFQSTQNTIMQFASNRYMDKYKEAVERDGENVPKLKGKIEMLNSLNDMSKKKEVDIVKEEKTTSTINKKNIDNDYDDR